MRTNADGEVILSETEQQTILEGMRLLSVYCENLTGCRECPFMRVKFIDDAGNKTRACECKSFMPCCWTIPDNWQKEDGDND